MTMARQMMRRVAAVGAGCGVIAAMTGLLGLIPATAVATGSGAFTSTPAADPAPLADDLRADVSLHEVTPITITPGGTVTLSGTVTNSGSETLEGPQALLRYSPEPLQSRDEVDQLYSDPTFRQGSRPGPPYYVRLGDELQPGVSADFSLEVAVDDLGLSASGVYMLGIEVLANDTSANAMAHRAAVGLSRTAIPFLVDDEPLPPVPVATVWNLESEPRISADESLVDDELATELGTDGRLGHLLRAGAHAPVTWLVDPDLLLTVDAMGTDYTVGTGDDTAPGTGEFAASGFWDSFVAARESSQTLLQPLADPDIESFVDAEPHLADRLIAAAVTGTDEVTRRLADNDFAPESATPEPELDAPTRDDQSGDDDVDAGDDASTNDAEERAPAGEQDSGGSAKLATRGSDTDPATLAASARVHGPVVRVADATLAPEVVDVYADAGVQNLILNPDTVRPSPSSPFATVPTDSGSMDVLVSDRGLDIALVEASGSQDPQGAATRLTQRWRAETAMIALEAQRNDTAPRALVAVPPAYWNPSSTTLGAVVDTWTNTPWIEASTVADLERPDPLPEVNLVDSASVGVLPIANVSATSELDATARHFTAMLPDSAAAETVPYRALDLAVVRSASRSWRSDPSAGLDYTTAIHDQLTTDIEQVTLSVPEQVTLSSSTGVFPLTVDNPLDYPVAVRIAVSSANPDRLRVDAVTEHTVQEGTRTTVNVEAEAFSNGRVPVRVGLVATDGTGLGPAQRTVVNATDYGAFGWVVVAAGILMLAWSVGRRAWRRRHPRDEADATLADMEAGLDPVAPERSAADSSVAGRHSKGTTSPHHTDEGVSR